MMGLAIAHEIRNQVIFDTEPVYSYPEFKEFEFDVRNDTDFGEEIVVI